MTFILKIPSFLLLLFFFCICHQTCFAQQDRFQFIEQRLEELAATNPGLKETVDFSVSGVSIQEFLRGVAESNNLNINIDPQLSIKVYNNFTNEKVANVLLFLVKEYNLDIRFVGSIMSFYKYASPQEVIKYIPKEILVKYNNYNNLLSLDLKSDTLDAVVKKITQISKKNVILASGLTTTLVSVYIEDMPFFNALQKMAYANNLKIEKTDDDFYLFRKRAEGEEIEQTLPTNPRGQRKAFAGTGNSPVKNAITGNFQLEITDTLGKKLISLDAVNMPILDALKAVSEEVGISYFLFSEIRGTVTTKITNIEFGPFLTYLLRGTDYTYKVEKDLYMIGERKSEGLRENKVFQFQYRSFSDIQETIPAEIRKGVEIKEFKELNSILLTGSLPQINEIEAFIKQLDRVVPMVMIEVILLDIRKGKMIKTGIKAGLQSQGDTIKTGGTLLPGIDFTFSSKSINDFLSKIGLNNSINLGRVTPNFYFGLSALEQNSNVEVRSMPKLSTLNGHEANLVIGSTRYYSTNTQNIVGTLTPQTVVTQQFTPVTANLSIGIKPIVTGDEQVTLNIDVSVSDFIGDPPANAPPPSSTNQFKSIVRVRNEEMIVLGGLERNEKSESGNGVPFLSRIPVLKWLFSSRSRSKNKSVSLVFIKPTIIY